MLLKKLVDTHFPVVWLVDVTLTLGNTTSQSVGNRHPEPQGTLGHLFHDALLRAALCLPATFSTDPVGPGTWVSISGKEKRLDYVAIPQDWLCCVTGDGVDRSVVLAIHRLSRVDLLLPKGTSCRAELPAPKHSPPTDLLKCRAPARL